MHAGSTRDLDCGFQDFWGLCTIDSEPPECKNMESG